MNEWINDVSVSEDEESRGQKVVNVGKVGTPEQFSGKKYKTEIHNRSSKNKSWR